jgi:hypothetical protein
MSCPTASCCGIVFSLVFAFFHSVGYAGGVSDHFEITLASLMTGSLSSFSRSVFMTSGMFSCS